MFDPLSELITEIKKVGFVNAHAHLDRAYTVSRQDFADSLVESHLFEKWKLIDKIKRESSEEDYFNRIEALQYAIANDDGQSSEKYKADIILFGVSRTSKTPTKNKKVPKYKKV